MAVLQVAIALIEARGRYLVCRRRSGSDFAGYWEFPGGKRHPGESWEACLRREALEELGVRLRAVRPDGRFRHDYPHRSVVFRVFRCRLTPRARPKPMSASALRWASPRTLRRLRVPPANRRLVERLAGPPRPLVGAARSRPQADALPAMGRRARIAASKTLEETRT